MSACALALAKQDLLRRWCRRSLKVHSILEWAPESITESTHPGRGAPGVALGRLG